MTKEKLNIPTVRSYWIKEAEEALTVAEHLLEKRDYSYALFFGHLAIEKMLKALYVENKKEHSPPTHNLQRLAREAGLSVNKERNQRLLLITSFNIEARYPDIKRSFRKKCTEEFTLEQMQVIRETFQWLKEMTT
jgi:HEPN domain-containing protein